MKRNVLLRYALLTSTWLIVLAVIIHAWVTDNQQPSIPILLLLAAISIVPLAARLRIGNWFDFTRKLENLEGDVSSAKQDIGNLSTQITSLGSIVHTSIMSKQAQSQLIANLPNPQTARAFAEAMAPPSDTLYPPPSISETKPKQDNVMYFLWAADKIIAQARFSLSSYYGFIFTIIQRRYFSESEDARASLEIVIQKMKNLCTQDLHAVPLLRKESMPYLDALQRLIELRRSVASGESDPPTIEEGREILSDASRAAWFFAGTVMGCLETLAFLGPEPTRSDSSTPST